MGRALVNKTEMKKGGAIKKAQKGVTTKKGRTTMNITDTSGYSAGKKAGYPAQMISPKTKYSKGDTTNVTVNRNTVSKAIKKSQNGSKTGPQSIEERRKILKESLQKAKTKDSLKIEKQKAYFKEHTEKALQKNKTGGMTKKCKYGCK